MTGTHPVVGTDPTAGTHPAAGIAAVVLAAGEGTRLRPLTELRPKALCPVANVPLIDLALRRVEDVLGAAATPGTVAVNAHHLAAQLVAHLDGRVHLSVEQPQALGTAGALGALRDWLAGRPVLVTNADAWLRGSLSGFLHGWDGERTRLAVVPDEVRADFAGRWRYCGVCVMPWSEVCALEPVPSGLYELRWRAAELAGRLDLWELEGEFVDCGTPSDYLRANLLASGGDSVVGQGARVDGDVVRSVVWPGAVVAAGERLVESIRTDTGMTVAAPLGS